jgi:hypothetical protein
MFGRKKDTSKRNQKENKIIKKEGVKVKKKHWMLKTVLILLLLSLASYGTYIYVENVKAKAYIQGGEDAIGMLTQAVEENGGAAINYQGKAITVSAYYKPIGDSVISANVIADTTTEETTQETSES